MPENHEFMKGWNIDSFLSWAKATDPIIHGYVETVFAQRAHPEQACRSCCGIQRLWKIYGTERLTEQLQFFLHNIKRTFLVYGEY
jgi:hypothetical protein